MSGQANDSTINDATITAKSEINSPEMPKLITSSKTIECRIFQLIENVLYSKMTQF